MKIRRLYGARIEAPEIAEWARLVLAGSRDAIMSGDTLVVRVGEAVYVTKVVALVLDDATDAAWTQWDAERRPEKRGAYP
jgi:hypothetical protein